MQTMLKSSHPGKRSDRKQRTDSSRITNQQAAPLGAAFFSLKGAFAEWTVLLFFLIVLVWIGGRIGACIVRFCRNVAVELLTAAFFCGMILL